MQKVGWCTQGEACAWLDILASGGGFVDSKRQNDVLNVIKTTSNASLYKLFHEQVIFIFQFNFIIIIIIFN